MSFPCALREKSCRFSAALFCFPLPRCFAAMDAVFDWIFGVCAGIKVSDDGAGYRKITIAPCPDARLGFADTAIDTRQGRVRVLWRYTENFIRYEIEIPDGTKAELTLPDLKKYRLGGGKYIFYTEKV